MPAGQGALASPAGAPAAPGSPGSPGPARAGVPQKLAEALSSQYGLNVFVAGLLCLLALAVHAAGVGQRHLLCLLSALMALQLLWMLWYVGRSYAHRRLIRPKDTHAGARWLRGTITLFAALSIILGLFKIGYFVGFSECLSATEGVFPVTHAVHTLLQVYFLWGHAKDIIQSFKTLERFGVIHSVFTNLLLWANSVLNESKHQLNEHKARLITLGFGNITIVLDDHSPPCNCTPPGLCSAIGHGIYYLYPFNIEYQILASTMLYVLWKNIGRRVDGAQHRRARFKFDGVLLGSALGLAALAATIGVVAVYLVRIGRSKSKSEAALTMFYLYASALLLLMAAAGLVGVRLYRLDEKSLDESKSPARKLDTDLLVGTASGSWLISWGSILAFACADTCPPYAWFNLPYAALVIVEKYIQNLFIIESAHRAPAPRARDVRALRVVTVCGGQASGPAGDTPPAAAANGGPRGKEERERGPEDAPGPACPPGRPRGDVARSALRNIAAFLFFGNISLWIPPAFGCRPEYDNGLEEIVFGFEPWIIVVNLAMPFSIFYRMHAAASLFEVYCKM
ncbi:proton channel OTOP1 [Perognathus longimembris pacificus]|uniref:proton channel OTOP1 n=1 Tax=Perognathus longimembris pacificus TaxID=214514 RepID=UPI00201A2289|nr:proton channel OTOP1 [Perognathus longimembris pacificus]